MILNSKFSLQIQKPIKDVFEGIVNPEQLTKYFISESSGRMETGKDLTWKFPEFETRFPITKVEVVEHESISFVWDPETVVKITLKSLPDKSTLVEASEAGKQNNEENIKWLVSNAGGWSNFLACMKAYLEYGIELRKGAFDFMRKE